MAYPLSPGLPDEPDYQRVFEASPSPYLILAPDSTILAANDAFLAITRTRREQIFGRRLAEIFPDRPGEPSAAGHRALVQSLDRVMETRSTDTMPIERYDLPRPKGSGLEEHYWSPVNTPVLDEYGEVACIIHRVEDVTQFVRLMGATPAINSAGLPNNQMESELFHRGRELYALNERLRQANSELAQIDKAKTEFFQNISHEFRTPLTLLIGPLEQLIQSPPALDEAQHTQLQLAHRNALRLQKLVNTLLDFARIEAGRVEAWYEPTDLAALTRELAENFRPPIEQAGLIFSVDCPPMTEPAFVDREMWEKIVLNLLSNAFKFTRTGRIEVRLSADDGQVHLTVQDTGTGIPEGELPRLFERFHRVEETEGRVREGSGIGLVLVQDLVKLHGGTIRVSSAYGTGTQVAVEIPLGSRHLSPARIKPERPLGALSGMATSYVQEALTWLPEETPPPVKGRRTARAAKGRRPRILAVDDNADMRRYLTRLLSPQYEVGTAADGKSALAIIRQSPPDLVLTDVLLTGINGFELLRQIREDRATSDIPVIMVSGSGGDHAVVEGLAAGADDYLVKPFKARELLARVATQLAQSAQARSERALRSDAEATRSRLELVLESVSDAVIGVSRDGRLTYLNNRAARRSGRPREELLGRDFLSLFPGADSQQIRQCLERVHRNHAPERLEHFSEVQSSWFETRIYPSPSGAVIFSADISQRKHVEQRLKDALTRLSMAAGIAGLGFWEWDLTTDRVYFSPEWKKQLGYADGELPNRLEEWTERLHPDDREEVLQRVGHFAEAPSPDFEIEYRLCNKESTYRWLNARWSALNLEEGRATRLAITHLDITAQKESEDRLRYVASHDVLTGLPNRLLLTEFAEHMLARARRTNGKLAVLFFDLDRFKAINDNYGHRIGDRVLQEAARRITRSVRSDDMVGRLGGDEFVAILGQVREERDVTQAARHALEALSAPYRIDQLELHTPPSIGISFFPDDGDSVESLIQHADTAMYHAKAGGGHGYQFFTHELNRKSQTRTSIENRMKADLAAGAFSLVYQPVFDAATGHVVSVEALLRWPGMELAPADFIPIAEQTGLIHDLGRWSIKAACEQLQHLQREGLPPLPVAVNISPSQLFHKDFARSVASMVQQSGVRPSELRLEVPESAVMRDLTEVAPLLQQMKELGVDVDIDEFGHGCSSLEQLSRLPIHALKINTQFVSPTLIETVLALGENLGLDVIAERVENDATFTSLRQYRHLKLQGHRLCKPLPGPEFAAWYRDQDLSQHPGQ